MTQYTSFLLPLALYFLNASHYPHSDELYHILAARSLIETGEPRIADGIYDRTVAYTWLIAFALQTFGDNLISARLPSMLAMAGSVACLFAWLQFKVSFRAALIAAVFFAVSPFAIENAQFARFYAAQTLVFLFAAVMIHEAIDAPQKSARWLGLLALPLFAAATYLQLTTLIGLVGIGLWVFLRLATRWFRYLPAGSRTAPYILILALVTLIVGLITLAWASGLLQTLWSEYRSVSLFNQSRANQFWFYHLIYSVNYPTLWPLIGLIALAAVARRSEPALFCVIVFATSFLLNSIAAPKSMRYIMYAQPFFFAIIGICIASLWPALSAWTAGIRERLSAALPFTAGLSAGIVNTLFVGALTFLLLGNGFFFNSIALLAGFTIPPSMPPIDWRTVAPVLQPRIDAADVVLTQAELEMLYYYERYDILLSASRLGENPGAVDFDADFRTGKPIIASIASVRRVLHCYPRGIFVTTAGRWMNTNYIDADVSTLIEQSTTPVDLPGNSGVIAYTWQHDNVSGSGEMCDGLPHFVRSNRN